MVKCQTAITAHVALYMVWLFCIVVQMAFVIIVLYSVHCLCDHYEQKGIDFEELLDAECLSFA